MDLNMVVRYSNNKPYLAYFMEFGEENSVYVHETATKEDCKVKLFEKLSSNFKLKAAESKFLNPEDKIGMTISI